MSFTVKLVIFPPWKAPVPSKTIGTFATAEEAASAGERALVPIAKCELSKLAGQLMPQSASVDGQTISSIDVPNEAVHGYVIYDAEGVEVGNWTTLDVALAGADRA